MKKKTVSFVIPCYRSELTLESVINEIDETMAGMDYDYEIILVNDGSPDNTWGKIQEIAAKRADGKVLGINFAKNFGQHAALMAGLNNTKGDYVICLDDDGQTPANEVGKLLAALEGDADAVYARYGHKQHNLFRNFGTAMNEWMASVMLGKPRDLFVSSYFGVRRFVVEEMVKYESSYPYVIGLVLRSTKNIVNVDVNHRKREVGTSGYTFAKLLGLWINGFTAFSIKPLRIATLSGSIFACLGFMYGIYTIIKKFVNPNVPVGFSAMMSAIIFIGGMVMLMLGMVGEYLGRVYISQNKNPQYVIRETTSQKEE
ncbi:glycosyltransferase family 2 protein [Butyrivibrio sp. AE2015]|uniref:glycosyltransferase family 2 protein n=1 Tax=Butyrivibrio sp. AE2015 TaxID=1280663 RepID=UPI0003B70EC3|nr:glycosyltransferase family 2 protein [Butyrivibrio sp. AE2015]